MKRWRLLVACATIALLGLLAVPSHTQTQLPNEIVIGGPISLAGSLAKEGQQGNWGFQLAERWVNSEYGGIRLGDKKIPVKYKFYDDESKRDSVPSLLERLITADGVKFLLAPYSTGLTLAGAPVAEKYKTLYMSHGGAGDRIFEQGYKYAVQTIGLGSRYQTSFLDMIKVIDPNAKKLALLSEDDEFTRSVIKGTKDYIAAKKLDFQIVFERTYPSAVKDLTPALNEMKAAAPDVLLGGGHAADGQLLAKQLGDLGIEVKAASILVSPALPAFFQTLGKQANGFASPAHWEIGVKFSPDTVKAKGLEYFGPSQDWFVTEFKKISKNVDPEYHAANAMASILVYVKAIEKAQTLDVDKIRAAMNELDFVPFYGAWKIDPATGKQIGHDLVLIQWQKGAKEIIWPVEAQTAKPCYPMSTCPGR
jgi:branched-chain amino acid transport system substrate-binding protein